MTTKQDEQYDDGAIPSSPYVWQNGHIAGTEAERERITRFIKNAEMSPGAHECQYPKGSDGYRAPDFCRGCLLLKVIEAITGKNDA